MQNYENIFSLLGTKWCGIGNIAKNDSDFGVMIDTDKCCQRHDKCPHSIEALTWKYGMFNWHFTEMFLCSCEEGFKSCLNDVKRKEKKLARSIGNAYFGLLLFKQCFVLNEDDEGKLVASYGKFPRFP